MLIHSFTDLVRNKRLGAYFLPHTQVISAYMVKTSIYIIHNIIWVAEKEVEAKSTAKTLGPGRLTLTPSPSPLATADKKLNPSGVCGVHQMKLGAKLFPSSVFNVSSWCSNGSILVGLAVDIKVRKASSCSAQSIKSTWYHRSVYGINFHCSSISITWRDYGRVY